MPAVICIFPIQVRGPASRLTLIARQRSRLPAGRRPGAAFRADLLLTTYADNRLALVKNSPLFKSCVLTQDSPLFKHDFPAVYLFDRRN